MFLLEQNWPGKRYQSKASAVIVNFIAVCLQNGCVMLMQVFPIRVKSTNMGYKKTSSLLQKECYPYHTNIICMIFFTNNHFNTINVYFLF